MSEPLSQSLSSLPGHATPGWLALLLMAFVLGLRHGFDADHLATIDGLSRYNAQRRPGIAGWCGALFSLGHGLVVLPVAVIVAQLGAVWRLPAWLDGFADGVSIVFLCALAVANLAALAAAAPDAVVPMAGLKGRALQRLLGPFSGVSRAASVMGVGALFALSFDTLSQVALFGYAGVQAGGALHALQLAATFIAGMLLTDGLNGWWIAQLIRRADEGARIASRLMSLAVSGLSLAVAGLIASRHMLPAFGTWIEGREVWCGLAVMLTVFAAFLIGLRLARSPIAVLAGPR
jgi:high-affinity nickel-transport protein